ncbi:GNAT superfamily N-acetyltransferase [Dietzia sp. 2505]|uniref:GNAT family N-acetyltransferase n=1 Tax=Dietzia sp. 2505 TaxID=3156457 RepID=UPI0033956CA1
MIASLGPTVDPAVAADLGPIAELAARTFPLACPPDLPRASIDAFIDRHLSAGALRVHLDTPGHDLLAARTPDGRLVGYALLVDGIEMDPTCADQILHRPTVGISKLYVDPGHHGSGFAALVLDDVVRRCVGRGVRGLWLATNVANIRARRFYARQGFVERGTRTFDVGGVSNTDVVYERALSGTAAGPG